MTTFYAYGETIITLFNENGDVIGEDVGHKPIYEIEAASLEEAENAPLEAWEFTGDSNGTYGATMYKNYSYEDIWDQETKLIDVYNIDTDYYP